MKNYEKKKGSGKMARRFCYSCIFLSLSIFYLKTEHIKIDRAPMEEVTMERVVDGDTVVVRRKDGESVKIRMIGVNTPESVSPDKAKNTAEGEAASQFTKSRLLKGEKVYLEYDKERTDKYGRTLAYIWLRDCDRHSYKDFLKYNYGAVLLQGTYCEAIYYAPNGKYRTWYEGLDHGK